MAADYLKTAQIAEAIVELRDALRLRPGDPPSKRLLGTALRLAGRATESRQLGS